ncbi:T9SS type A sorting domain-containing protein [Spirosoma arboris]|nr:T9SS type A sorting domain-containing protein [Spirosoma arboris]
MNSNITIADGATATIAPGVDIYSKSYSDQLSVSGTLIAKGTPTDSIRFVGFANPSNSVSSHGGQILFPNNNNSELEYVVVDRWGDLQYYGSAISNYSSTLKIANSIIRNSENMGIYNGGSSPTITSSSIYGNVTGIYNASGKPILQSNKIYSNSDYGINNAGSDTLDARSTYWGTPSGPYHATLNSTGTGNKVSDKVLFVPWIEQLIQVDQSVNFPEIANKYVDEPVVLNATATSGLPVSYTITTVPVSGVASLTGTTITFSGTVGQVTVTASQAGNEYFKPAEAQRTFSVSKRSQYISLTPVSPKTFGDAPFSLTATATSGLPVTFSVVSGPATLDGNTITLTAAGTVLIEARQVGNNVYDPASPIQQSFLVYERLPDLAVKDVSSNKTVVGLSDTVTVSWNISNDGIAASPINWTERIYVQSPSGINRSFLKDITYSTSSSLAIGQSISRSSTVTVPSNLLVGDEAVFVVEVVPGPTVQETPGTQANNIAIQPTPWTIQKGLFLSLSANEITEGNTTGITATVSRTGSVSAELTVTVSLTNSARLTYPTSVVIPAGYSSISFAIAAPDNTTVEGQTTDQVQVSASGYQGAQAGLVIIDNDLPALSITNLPASSMEGDTVKFRVATNLAPTSPLTVFLQSSSPTRFPAPASVTIAAGALYADVSIILAQDDIPELDLDVTLSAGAANHTPDSKTIVITDDDFPHLELVLQTNAISEAAGLNATQATLRRTPSSNSLAFTANLSASLPNTLILPGAISLAAGENEKTFTIGVVNNTVVDGQRQVEINASLFVSSCGCNAPPTSSGSVSATLTVNDDDGPSLLLTVSQQTLPEGVANAGSLRIARNTATTDALSVTLVSSDVTEATVPATVEIPAGQSFVDVNITTLDDSITDGNQQVYFTATAPGFSSGSIWVIVTDLNKPDLQIPTLQLSSNSVPASSTVTYQVSIKNTGSATAPSGTLVRGYLSVDNTIDASDVLISESLLGEAIPAGQTKVFASSFKAPDAPGVYKVLFWVNPTATLTELLLTNNVSDPASLTVEPAYTATAQIGPTYFMQGNSMSITGTATRSNGATVANAQVEVYVITKGIRRQVLTLANASGNYSVQFTPLASESGHYIVGASFPGLNQTTEQDAFDILGVRINGGTSAQFKTTLNEPLTGALSVENLSDKSLTNFTLAPLALPNGASIQFATLPTLAGNASANLGYTVVGSALTNGNNFETARFQAKSDEGVIQNANVYYYCQAANGYIVANVSTIQAVVSQSSGERRVEIKLVNKGKGVTGPITLSLPQTNWLNSVTAQTLPSLASGDSTTVILKFLALAEVPFNYPITGSIGINSTNANSVSIPFTFQKVSESAGTARITVTDQFTYYTDGGPKVAGALVRITNYFTGELYAEGSSDANGVFVASNVPEGKHRITVEKDKHTPYSNVLEITPGSTVESTVFLNYQAITFSWTVVPTAVQDQYTVVLEAKYETNVPAPVVTMDMPKTMPHLATGQEYLFNIVLTNHGLITAQQVTLTLPTTDPEYEFVTNYTPSDLLANQSIQVPVIMRRRNGATSPGPNEAPCVGFVGVSYSYRLNATTNLGDKTGASFIYESRDCGPGTGTVVVGGSTVTPEQYNALYDAWSAGIAGIETTGGDAPCANCTGSAPSGGTADPTPPVEQQKTSCVACIADISTAITGCTPASNVASILACYTSVTLTGAGHDKGTGLINCAANGSAGFVAGKVPGSGQVLCVSGVLSAIQTCDNTDGQFAVFDEISANLQVVVNGYNAVNNWMSQYFGDLITKEGWTALFPLVSTYLNDQTPIPANAQSSIISAMAGYDISSSALSAFFTRWNTSLEAKAQNVLAPNSTYPNIINWTLVDGYVAALIEAHNHAVSRGFKTVDDMHKESIKSLNTIIDNQKNDICASVSVQFTQKLTMTREAFLGTLEIFNGHPTDAMKMIAVNLQITDASGTPSNGLFEIQTQSFNNLANVTGSGQISAQQRGSVTYLFIPQPDAAPQAPTIYKFGGSVTYFDPYAKATVTIPLIPVPITVNPSPSLMLHYFMQRNILGDDALTSPDIEPSIPAELAVMIENKGYGQATNVTISSAKPEVVDNASGLAIDFNLVGTKFKGQSQNLSLTDIPFGNIPALETRVGEWYFTSTLLGKFVSYSANVVHNNSYGNSKLSLIQGVKLHELTKSIRLYGNLEDGINDFLVNDIFDVDDQPDIIYFSQGNRTAKVNTASGGSFDSPVSAPSFTNTLTVTPSDTGFNYIKLNDPGNRLYELVSVTRSDGQVIPLDNAWLTFVTLPVARSPIYENKFHIVDRFTSAGPATYTVVWKPVDVNVPKVDSITGVPAQSASAQVTNLKVYFSKPINPATFTYQDLSLTFQGGQNIINSSVVITQIDPTTFNVDLSAITTGNGNYLFTVQAANVEDIYGISGTVGKQVSWSQFMGVPFVQAFQGIPANHKASSYSTIQLLFNLPIDVATVTPARFTIYKNGVLQAGSLAIDSVSSDHKLFRLSGLQTMLTQNGIYELRVDLPNIKSENHIAGVQTQSVVLTVDNAGPVVLLLEKSTQGGIDSQHVPFVNITFDEGVVGLNTAAFQLTRNGEVVPITSTMLSFVDAKNWKAGNFGLLTYPEGNYTFSVNLGNVIDSTGNAGVGTQQISWIVNRSSSVSFTGLASSYCSTATSQTLVGAPSGGVFSGPGITGNTFNPSVAGAGTHTITYTKDGQPVSQTTTVYSVPELAISPSSATLTCASPTVSLSAIGSGSLLWSNGQTTPSISVSLAGTYSVTLTSATGCTATSSIVIGGDRNIGVASILPSLTVLTCATPTTSLTATGGNTYKWSTGANGAVLTVSPTITTTYSVTATGANGCTAVASRTIEVDKTVPTAWLAASQTAVTCDSPVASLTASAAASYRWSTGETTAAISVAPTTATTYSVTLTGTNSCTAVVNYTIAVDKTPPTPAIVTSRTLVSCNTPSVSLTASGGSSYKWSTGATGSVLTVSPATTTTYSVTVIGANGCTAVATQLIQVDKTVPIASLLASATAITCATPTVSLTASGGVSYKWSTGETSETVSVSPLTTTTYSVTVIGANGCATVAARTINVNQTPPVATLTASQTILNCTNPTASLSASGGVSYLWSTGETTAAINVAPTTATTYSVTVTGANGCLAVATRSIAVDQTLPTPAIATNRTLVGCISPTVSLTVSGGTSYKWSTGATTSVITTSPTTTTTYSVTVTGSNGCKAVATQLIEVDKTPPTASLLASATAITCASSTVSLTASGGVSYKWSTGETTDTVTVSPLTTTAYAVTVTAENGCSSVLKRSIGVNQTSPSVTLTASRTVVSCTYPTATLTAGSAASYLWSTGETTRSISVTPTTATTYSVTLTGANGCTAVASDSITVSQTLPTPVIVANRTLVGCTTQTASLTVSGGVNYKWSNGSTLTVQTVNPTTTTTYSVTVTGSNGCKAVATQLIEVDKTPPTASLLASATAITCASSTVSLTASGGVSYKWSTGETTDTVTVSPLTTTAYAVTVTAENGCSSVLKRSIGVNQTSPSVTLTASRTVVSCTYPTATLTAGSAASYLWSTGETTRSISVTPTTATTYSVTLTGANGCTAVASDSITVSQTPPTPVIVANRTLVGCTTQTASLTVSGGVNYKWSNGSTLTVQTVNPTTTTTYSVTVTGSNGCKAVATQLIEVDKTPPTASLLASATVCEGTDYDLLATATGGKAPYTYSWSVPGGQGSTLPISTSGLSLTTITTRTYSVTVIGANNCVSNKASFVLTINPSAKLTQQPVSGSSVCAGTTVVASVLAVGRNLTYAWMKSGSTTVLSTSRTLTLPSVTVASEGSYYAVVSSDCGSVSSNLFTLTINPATQLMAQPASATVAAGQSFTTSVAASGSSLSYQWYYGGTTVLNDQNSATLTIAGVTPANAGLYTCRISGLCGNVVSQAAKLTVSSAQSRLGASEPVNTLAFTVSAYPNPTSDKVVVRVDGGGKQPTIKLRLYDVSAHKLGDWLVELENGQGETTLNLGNLPTGLYLLEAQGDKEVIIKRLQKQ